jgi:hypothetical protein
MSISIQDIVDKTRVNEETITSWLQKHQVTQNIIENAYSEMTEACFRNMITNDFKPESYLFHYPQLSQYVFHIKDNEIKSIPFTVFLKHLENLKQSCESNDIRINAFIILYLAKKKSELKFCRSMFVRRISHYSYESAKAKFNSLAQSLLHSNI